MAFRLWPFSPKENGAPQSFPVRSNRKMALDFRQMKKLYIATSNPGKLRDFAAAAMQLASIEPLPNLKQIPAPPEDALNFEGNARAKAIYYSRFATGEIVIADDSGLEVDALNGEPGVRSARYAEDQGFAGL